MTQPTLYDAVVADRCCYGTGSPTYAGPGSICDQPVTHIAHSTWVRGDRTGHSQVRACRTHANFYATAWMPLSLQLGFDGGTQGDTAWIEVLR